MSQLRVLHSRGFTLIELSIVLLILGILARTAILPLAGIREAGLRRSAAADLASIKQSLIAYVVATGAVPCPLPVDGANLIADGLPCQVDEGSVPAIRLGISGSIDAAGALLDAWNRPYHFSVSLEDHADRGDPNKPDWTSVGESSQVGIAQLSADLTVCQQTSGGDCRGRDIRSQQVVFVVWTSGVDISADGVQAENLDKDRFLIEREYSMHKDQPFDDQLVWATASDIIYWQLKAGWLP